MAPKVPTVGADGAWRTSAASVHPGFIRMLPERQKSPYGNQDSPPHVEGQILE
jgi:hypothetical protein